MSTDERLAVERFPRSSAYHPDWVLASASGGANSLWLTEWLSEALELRPGMSVLDLGCGRAASSIFLHREFGVRVWATDLWFNPSENAERVRDAGAGDAVAPIGADARSLPFADDFFDAIVSIDSFPFFGTDDLYLNYILKFLKPGGALAIAQAGLIHDFGLDVPPHLADWWNAERPYCLHSAEWWREHWAVTGLADVELADDMPEGWRYWRDWLKVVAPENVTEIDAIEADQGRSMGYVRAVCRRRADAELFDPAMSFPADYSAQPLLRGSSTKPASE